ncbi:MAG: AraC family transcriptional regulator [Candidatus Obscuribacterales bacterium]|nr:AraC family transcriptional regulator [Candidatus Obscuribacterales bacterium]
MELLIGKAEFKKPRGHHVTTHRSPYLTFAIRQSEHANQVPFHKHEYDEFIFSPSGLDYLHWSSDGGVVECALSSTTLLWTPAGVKHAASWRTAWYSVGILLSSEIVREQLLAGKILRPTNTVFFEAGRDLQKLLQLSLGESWLSRLSEPGFARSLATLLSAELIDAYRISSACNRGTRRPAEEFSLETLSAFIDENLAQDVSVKELAQLVHLSPFHFSRVFKAQTGSSPYRFILNRRLARAVILLPQFDLAIDDIAKQVGFLSAASFTKAFKKTYGITPGKYRDNLNS